MSTVLDALPFLTAIIATDRSVHVVSRHTDSPLFDRHAGLCHEVLAGSPDVCPFCPLEDMLEGKAGGVSNQLQVRRGRTCIVNVSPAFNDDGDVLLVETVQELTLQEVDQEYSVSRVEELFDTLRIRTARSEIAKHLLGELYFEQQIDSIVPIVNRAVQHPDYTFITIELDDRLYGRPVRTTEALEQFETPISLDRRLRGKITATYSDNCGITDQDRRFLGEIAGLIARRLEIHEREAALRSTEEEYKKLAGNLEREMWYRTDALAKETKYLEGILRSSDDMIITTDLNSRIVEFNPGAERILGFAAEEVQGKDITCLWENAEERSEIMGRLTEEEGVKNHETRLRTKSGDFKEVSLTLSLLKDEGGHILGTVGVSKDISREKAIRRELERLNRNYRETIHFISHESKNSLIVMGGFVRRLLDGEEDEKKRSQLQIVYHHSKFLEAMSRDFLVMAELEHGELQIRKDCITDFYQEVILPAMIGLKERYPDSFGSYDTSMGGVGDVCVLGDAGLLQIVFRNLFGNALKYRSEDGRIAYGVTDRGKEYVFNVWNEGPGVAPELVYKIFEKFYRVPDETTRMKKGTGLGLYNIKRIIKLHGGRIWCESEQGSWINFLFTLPKSDCGRSRPA